MTAGGVVPVSSAVADVVSAAAPPVPADVPVVTVVADVAGVGASSAIALVAPMPNAEEAVTMATAAPMAAPRRTPAVQDCFMGSPWMLFGTPGGALILEVSRHGRS